MKKITAFFLALFPILAIVILFASGLIVKQYIHVFVTSIEFTEDKWDPQIKDVNIEHPTDTHQLYVNVLPRNASNPEVYYLSTNEDIATVNDTGLVTIHDFGEAEIIAVSKENQSITASLPIKVWDDKIHRIDVINEVDATYLGYNQSVQINAVPVPNGDLLPEIDPTIEFSSSDLDHTYVTVSESGQMVANEEDTDATHPVVVTALIKGLSPQPKEIKKEFAVNVGPGVTSIDLDNPSFETIKSDKYSLYKNILTFPEQNPQKIKPEDFEYTTSDAEVASINKSGEVEFKKPGKSTFTATYKRNTMLSVKKTLESTFLYATDVAFNRYTYEQGFATKPIHQEISKDELNWHVYPENPATNLDDDIVIESSDETIVSVEDNQHIYIENYGTATLTATVKIGEETTKKDVCTVNIYDDTHQTFLKVKDDPAHPDQVIKTGDSYLYALRDNVDKTKLLNPNDPITWTIIDSSGILQDVAKIDDNEQICFNVAGNEWVQVRAQYRDWEPETFTIVCNNTLSAQNLTVDEDFDTLTVEAGKKYRIYAADGTALYIDREDREDISSRVFFGEDSEGYWFIPRSGYFFNQSIDLYYGEIIPIIAYGWVTLIVTQTASDIIANPAFPKLVTTASQVDVTDEISAYPRTATGPDGKKFTPAYTFTPESEQIAYVEDNKINFRESGYVDVTATLGSTTVNYTISSTMGNIGKFDLRDSEGNTIQSGDDITLNPAETGDNARILYLNHCFIGETEKSSIDLSQFQIKSNSGITKCVAKYDETNDEIEFVIEPKGNQFGYDVITIQSSSFIFYLDVEVTTAITNFNLYFNGEKLKSNDENITYNDDEITLDIEALPLKAMSGQKIKDVCIVKDNGTQITIKNVGVGGEITILKRDTGNHTITVQSKDDASIVNEFQLNFVDPSTITDFTIVEATKNEAGTPTTPNMVYMPAGATRCALTVSVDGLVDKDFYEEYFSCYYDPKQEGECLPNPTYNQFLINKIPRPSSGSFKPWESKITIKFTPTNLERDYKISRDVISKITLPNHDNKTSYDKAGLQKVRVYGNQSQYPDEGIVDYYRLPIRIFDYSGKEIINEADREEAIKTLRIDLHSGQNTLTPPEYDASRGVFKIKFDENALYSPKEMYENAFEKHDKTVFFTAQTESSYNKPNFGFPKAEYEFVPVKGINAYDQRPFELKRKEIVLQTNFGLQGATKDNAPFTIDHLIENGMIYGNGYTLNFNSMCAITTFDDNDYLTDGLMNITLQGCNEDILRTTNLDIQIEQDGGDQIPRYLAYNILKNIPEGIYIRNGTTAYVKNCLVYNNTWTSFNINQNNHDDLPPLRAYLENIILFNSSSVAFDIVRKANAYFKGFIDVYNFRNRDVLSNILGHDLSFLWPVVEDVLIGKHAMQRGVDGRTYLNSYAVTEEDGKCYFWDEATGTYVEDSKGRPGAAEHMRQLVDVDVPSLGNVSLWGTLNPNDPESGDPTAPSYYDEFDQQGNLRWDFLNLQIRKIERQINRWMLIFGC